MASVAKITAKGQTTIPVRVREALHAGPGDFLSWEVEQDGTARVRRVQAVDVDYLRGLERTLGEWASPQDEEAFRDL